MKNENKLTNIIFDSALLIGGIVFTYHLSRYTIYLWGYLNLGCLTPDQLKEGSQIIILIPILALQISVSIVVLFLLKLIKSKPIKSYHKEGLFYWLVFGFIKMLPAGLVAGIFASLIRSRFSLDIDEIIAGLIQSGVLSAILILIFTNTLGIYLEFNSRSDFSQRNEP